MKKKFVHLFFVALMVIGVVGCKEHEQSELEFGSIQDTAYVTGTITYSLGQDTLSNDYVAEVVKPAVGRKIYVDVPLSSYQAGAQGNKIFTGVVDENGHVSIAVPVKSDGISGATLRYEEFTAERAEYLKMVDGKPVFEVRMNKFETPGAIASLPTLMPGSNSIGEEKELRYVHTVIDMKDYAETAVFSGKLLLPYEVSYHTGAYKAAANCQVEITIQDGEDVLEVGSMDAPKYSYGCVTNNTGEFALNIPIKNMRAGFHIIEAKVVPLGDAGFVHYTDVSGKSEKVAGAYKLRTDWEAGVNIHNVAEVIEGIECSIGVCPLEFVPGYNNGIADPVLPVAWESDLAGWVFGEKEFADMTSTAKLTGSLKLAQETSFAIGSYTTSIQSIKIKGSVAPYNKTFAVLANADGTFELEIPIEQEGANPGVNWTVELVQPNNVAFTHYVAPAQTIVIKEGEYNLYEKLRAIDADWNQLGDFYFKFAPSSVVDTWNSDLAGWFVKEDYDEKSTITVKVYLAYESAYAIGSYQGAEGHRVRVGVQYPDALVNLVAPVQADGTVSMEIPVKSANNAYTADNITLLDDEIDDFNHYTKKGLEYVSGTFVQEYKFEDKDASWNNKWTLYYTFNPTSSPASWHADLAGWFKKEGYDKSATATGKAFFAKEKSYAIGEYVPAANEVITISVAELGAQLQVPVKNDGSFSVALPMKDAYDEYTLSASAGAVDVDDFVHYKDHGKTSTLEGKYNAGNPLKNDDAAWNEMGTYYFKFTPDNSVETYTNKLFGWQKYDAKYANKDKSIVGSIMLAEETGFWKGTYVPYANEKVLISYSLGTQDFEMVVLTDANGAFDCVAYREFGDDEPAVTASPMVVEVDDFVHYYHVTSPTPMKIEGKYNFYRSTVNGDWNNKGISYYKFQPKSATTEWSDNLLGWYKQPEAEGRATFRLYAQKAVESTTAGSHEADWADAGNTVMATVNISSPGDNKSFDVLVAGKNIVLSNVPFLNKVEDGDGFSVSIQLRHPSNISGYPAVNDFRHYPEPTEDKYSEISGKYQGVAFNASEVSSSGVVEIRKSAKLLFNPTSSPTGWSNYDWSSILDHTIDD